jgi:hypothetical protein
VTGGRKFLITNTSLLESQSAKLVIGVILLFFCEPGVILLDCRLGVERGIVPLSSFNNIYH